MERDVHLNRNPHQYEPDASPSHVRCQNCIGTWETAAVGELNVPDDENKYTNHKNPVLESDAFESQRLEQLRDLRILRVDILEQHNLGRRIVF